MRALVTGGAGFIGCNLAKRLLEIGWEVAVIDNLMTGSRENIVEYVVPAGRERFVFFEDDFCSRVALSTVFQTFEPEVIFHVGALPRVQFSIKAPQQTNNVNIGGTLNLLTFAKARGEEYSGSAEQYFKSQLATVAKKTKNKNGRVVQWEKVQE